MQLALQSEECGGFVRCLPVRCLDGDTRLKARKCFTDYRMRGIIRNAAFEDNIWTLTDEVRNYTIDFRFDTQRFRLKAETWIGCTQQCYRECMKAYIAFQLGSYTLSYLQMMTNGMKLIAGMTKEEAETIERNDRTHIVGFLFLIPGSNDLKDRVIETLEEREWTLHLGAPRALADFPRYLRFNKSLDEFWTRATQKEKLFYFPVYFWWKLTAVLPLRVTEFLLTPHECLSREKGKFLLSVRRSKLKKGGRKLSYTVESDYFLQKYEIPQWLFHEILAYQEATANDAPLVSLGTLLVPERPVSSGYFTYVQLSVRLKRFYAEILGDENCPIHAGDTRHLAMISLILSGGSPVICRELAGHESVAISSHYYANLSTIVESAVYEQCRGRREASALEGSLRFPAAPPAQKVRLEHGWCDVPAVARGDITECLKCYDRSGQMGKCVNCAHFYPDCPGVRLKLEHESKAAVDGDGEYLMGMIELVRKGLGYEEDIAAALLRLHNSTRRYASLLSEKYREENENGKA